MNGTAADFKIYHEQFFSGVYESLAKKLEVFNGASNNTLRLMQRKRLGEFAKESFLKSIEGLVSRVDRTSTADATALKFEMDENVSVKLDRKIGPVVQTLNSWVKVGKNLDEMSYQLGKAVGPAILDDYIQTATLCAVSTISGQSTNTKDVTGVSGVDGTLTHSNINDTFALMGDMSSSINCLVMDGYSYHQLVGNAIAENVFEVGGAAIKSGIPATFGKPVLVIDANALSYNDGADRKILLGLTENAVAVEESEAQAIFGETVTGKQQLLGRMQGEHAFNVQVKGFAWKTTAGSNPTDASLASSSNWKTTASSHKALAGVCLKFNKQAA